MEEIIQKAMYYSALAYVNGNENLIDVWDQSFGTDKKSKDIAEMIEAMGYELKKKEI